MYGLDVRSTGWSDSTIDARKRLGALAQTNVSLARYSSYRVGGDAAVMATCSNIREVEQVAKAVEASGVETLVVGRGSKLLVADRGFDGLAIRLKGDFVLTDIDLATGTVRAGSAAFLPRLARNTGDAGLAGLEWAEGVPGSVGGSIRMNAGCYGGDIEKLVVHVTVARLIGGAVEQIKTSDLRFEHRDSSLEQTDLVLDATLQLRENDPKENRRVREEHRRERNSSQPARTLRTGGSVFRTPDAWRLIRQAGAHELKVGRASVSPTHSNFIEVSRGPVTGADDVLELMCRIKSVVLEKTGRSLIPETRMFGFEHDVIKSLADS